jgi:hypothetical protein
MRLGYPLGRCGEKNALFEVWTKTMYGAGYAADQAERLFCITEIDAPE